MSLTTRNKGYIFVVLAAFFWSTLGLISKSLYESGFSSDEVTSIRISFGTLFLLPLFIKNISIIIRLKLKQFILLGFYAFTGILLFYWVEMESFKQNPTGIAYVLLYTAPLLIIIYETIFLKLKLTSIKWIGAVLILLGMSLISGLFYQFSLTLSGFLLAFGSAIFYAAYSLWGSYFAKQLNSNQIVPTIFLMASVVAIFSFPVQKISEIQQISSIFPILYLGLVPTALAYVFYNKSLHFITTSEAAIIATIEPVLAVLWGITLLGESLTGLQIIGIVLILSATVIIKIKE